MKQVNLNSLRIFSSVAEHRSLQRAADVLGLSRGAVSQRIRNPEVELGTVLLVRGARGVSLTPEGERCRAAVGEALAMLETAFRDIADAPDRVTLHLGSSAAAKWLMPRMAAFAERFPRVALVTEAHSERMPRSLGRSEMCCAPGRRPMGTPITSAES
ncbi:MAG: LysR family transcriptional regulator [Pseudomonadota bacterium]